MTGPDPKINSRKLEAGFTPFARDSHEPRFALEVPGTEAGVIALALDWSSFLSGPESRKFDACTDGAGQWLAVCVTGSFAAAFPPIPDGRVFRGLPRGEAAAEIGKWLRKKADYGDPPCFEGGEERGMRIFSVPFGQPPSAFYGWTVIQPAWFEVHK